LCAAKIESVAATTPGPEAYPVNTLLITAELSNVTAPETFPVPSKAPVVNVASPVPEIVLPAAKAVAVEAFPVKAPTKMSK
jgi:hypothetical protein